MNFFNSMVDQMGQRLKDKFDPNSAQFGAGGIIGGITNPQGGEGIVGHVMNPTGAPAPAPGANTPGAVSSGGNTPGFTSPAANALNVPMGPTAMGGFDSMHPSGAANPSAQPQNADASRQQEMRAHANGFANYAQMLAWARQRNTPSGGTIPEGSNPDTSGSGVPNPSVGGSYPMMMHPGNLFQYVYNKIKGATGAGQ